MSPKKAPCPGASLVALLLAFGLAGSAPAATYTIRPEIGVYQSLDDNVLSDDNQAGDRALGLPSGEISSWNTTISPQITLRRSSDTSEATLLAGFTRRETYSLSELDGTDELLGATARRSLSRRLSVGARANYASYASYNAIELLSQGVQPLILYAERPDLRWHNLAGDLKYALDDTTELMGEAEWNAWDYDRSSRTDLLDTEDRSLSLTLTKRVTQRDKTGLIGTYSFSEEGSSNTSLPVALGDLSFDLNNTAKLGTVLAFWERIWSPRWTTALQVGTRFLELENDTQTRRIAVCPGPPPFVCLQTLNFPTISDSGTGFVGGVSVVHSYSDRGRVTFSYARDTRIGQTSSAGSSAVDTDVFSLGVSHRLSSRLTLGLSGTQLFYETTDSGAEANSGTDTDYFYGELRLEWQVRKNMVAYTTFNYFDLEQEREIFFADPERDYQRRIFTFGIRYFFEHEL